jgi:hypothetical protein
MSRGRLVTHEDLAYLVGQFGDSRSGEYDNPALAPLHDALRIAEWMYADVSRRLVIVNPDAAIVEHSRGVLRGHERITTILGEIPAKGIPRWKEQGRFELIARCVEKITAADYLAAVAP